MVTRSPLLSPAVFRSFAMTVSRIFRLFALTESLVQAN